MNAITAAKVARIMAQLDAQGATFRVIPGHPDWYEARWPEPDQPKGYSRWAALDKDDEPERELARAFRVMAIRSIPAGSAKPPLAEP